MNTDTLRTQYSVFGYRYAGIIKRIKDVKTMGGEIVQQATLHHGIWTSFFKLIEQTDEYLILRCGLVTFKILKRDRRKNFINPS